MLKTRNLKMAGEISDVNLMESPPDKVVLVGDVGVGKTSLFMRFKTGHFVEGTTHNPREGEFRKKWTINGKEVSVSFINDPTGGGGHTNLSRSKGLLSISCRCLSDHASIVSRMLASSLSPHL